MYQNQRQNYNSATKMQNRRTRKPFSFSYQVRKNKVQNCKLLDVLMCELTISGMAYFNPSVATGDMEGNRFDADIDFILYNNCDVKGLLEATDLYADIEEAAVRHAAEIFCEPVHVEPEETPVVILIEKL